MGSLKYFFELPKLNFPQLSALPIDLVNNIFDQFYLRRSHVSKYTAILKDVLEDKFVAVVRVIVEGEVVFIVFDEEVVEFLLGLPVYSAFHSVLVVGVQNFVQLQDHLLVLSFLLVLSRNEAVVGGLS